MEQFTAPSEGIKKQILSKKGITIILVMLFFILGTWGAVYQYARSYDGRVIPGVSIGTTPIGGMSYDELRTFLQQMNDKLLSEGARIVLETPEGDKSLTLYPAFVSEENALELFSIPIDDEAIRLIQYGKEEQVFIRAFVMLKSRFVGTQQQLAVVADKERLEETVQQLLAPYETPARDAGVVVTQTDPLRFEVVTSSVGVQYPHEAVLREIVGSWSILALPSVRVSKQEAFPVVSDSDVAQALPSLESVFAAGPLVISYDSPNATKEKRWELSTADIAELLVVETQENGPVFSLSAPSTTAFLEETVAEEVYVEAQDAKFAIDDNGRVIEFSGSQTGLVLDVQATYDALRNRFIQRSTSNNVSTTTVSAVVQETAAQVNTEDVNNLGISELLGEGVSSYAGSPANRIKNIKNALKKLNGVLIAPGEEFSTIEHTQPYTLEGGYLPELVIKGNEIKPEIAGGLCQIGSTLFRMAMNSAMPIVERRNHSLVVNYYNDLSNGLPGTDATLYDPAPDFRFKNDTDEYILLQTLIDESEQTLTFQLWGTNDGREGSYSPPVVHRWIPHGPPQYVETTTLAPGVEQCQHAYRGADTSFVYTRRLADGTVQEETFESHYRPLQSICLVGVDPAQSTGCSLPEGCPDTAPETPEESSSEELPTTIPETEEAIVLE